MNKDNKKIKLQNIKKSTDLKLAPKRISRGREHERKIKFKSIWIRMFGINERFVSLEWRSIARLEHSKAIQWCHRKY